MILLDVTIIYQLTAGWEDLTGNYPSVQPGRRDVRRLCRDLFAATLAADEKAGRRGVRPPTTALITRRCELPMTDGNPMRGNAAVAAPFTAQRGRR